MSATRADLAQSLSKMGRELDELDTMLQQQSLQLSPNNLDLSFAAAADSDADTPMLGGATQHWSIGTHIEAPIHVSAAKPTRIPSPAAASPRAATTPPRSADSRIPSPARSTQSPARRGQKGLFGCLSPTRRTAVACASDDGEVVVRPTKPTTNPKATRSSPSHSRVSTVVPTAEHGTEAAARPGPAVEVIEFAADELRMDTTPPPSQPPSARRPQTPPPDSAASVRSHPVQCSPASSMGPSPQPGPSPLRGPGPPASGGVLTLSALRQLARHPAAVNAPDVDQPHCHSIEQSARAPSTNQQPPASQQPLHDDKLMGGSSHASAAAPTDRSQGSSLFSLEPDDALHAAARAQAAFLRHTTTTINADTMAPSGHCLTTRCPDATMPAVQTTPHLPRTQSAPPSQPETSQTKTPLSTGRRLGALQALKERRTLQRHASGASEGLDVGTSVDGSDCVHSATDESLSVDQGPATAVQSAPLTAFPFEVGATVPMRHAQAGAVRKPTQVGKAASNEGRRQQSSGVKGGGAATRLDWSHVPARTNSHIDPNLLPRPRPASAGQGREGQRGRRPGQHAQPEGGGSGASGTPGPYDDLISQVTDLIDHVRLVNR